MSYKQVANNFLLCGANCDVCELQIAFPCFCYMFLQSRFSNLIHMIKDPEKTNVFFAKILFYIDFIFTACYTIL